MIRRVLVVGALCVVSGSVMAAQTATVPRPPAQPAGLGQTRAPAPAKTETFTVETFAEGLNGAWFRFLPDGRILLGERTGSIKIIGKDGKAGAALTGMPANMFAPG